jgi:hypothetical protein
MDSAARGLLVTKSAAITPPAILATRMGGGEHEERLRVQHSTGRPTTRFLLFSVLLDVRSVVKKAD